MTTNRASLCDSFDEAIDVLTGALRACSAGLWEASLWPVPRTDPWVWPRPGMEPVPERTDESIQQFSAFWVIAYHCLWFLDFYVTTDPSGFQSPDYVRGGPEELEWPADGAAPLAEAAISREALLRYADHGRQRVRDRIEQASDAQLQAVCGPGHPRAGSTLAELFAINLAHVREHGQQLAQFVESRPLRSE